MPKRYLVPIGLLRNLTASRPPQGLKALANQKSAGSIQAQWRDSTGRPLGEAMTLRKPRKRSLEFPTVDGFARAIGEDSVTLPRRKPIQAVALTLSAFGLSETFALEEIETLPEKLGKPQVHFPAASGAKFIFPIVSERFDDFAHFAAKLDEFQHWLVQQPPFNEPAISGAIAVKGLFWPSDTAIGLFNTPDPPPHPTDRRFFGNRIVARKLVKEHLKGAAASLILINSRARGGAGGTPGFSAWSSIASENGEFWGAVALHEIGHSLGLADEYVDRNFSLREPIPLEPNVSAERRCGSTSWGGKVTVDPNLAPSHPANHAGAVPDVIGTFEGARYKPTGRYRPMQHCLMRETSKPFCQICRDHIRTILAPPA